MKEALCVAAAIGIEHSTKHNNKKLPRDMVHEIELTKE
jgi:hypothetical protein